MDAGQTDKLPRYLDPSMTIWTVDLDLLCQIDVVGHLPYNIEHISAQCRFELFPTLRPSATKCEIIVGTVGNQEPCLALTIGNLRTLISDLAINLLFVKQFKQTEIQLLYSLGNSLWNSALKEALFCDTLVMQIRMLQQ